MPETIYGYYSKKAAAAMGTLTYRRLDGSHVEVTMVDDAPDLKTGWDDMVCIGKVVRYGMVSNNKRGNMLPPSCDFQL